jgi:hypothetical protein
MMKIGFYYPKSYSHSFFRSDNGKLLMCIHSHKNINGRYVRIPHLFEADVSGNKLVVGKPYTFK